MCVNVSEAGRTLRMLGAELKRVHEFKYLESAMQSNGECRKELKKWDREGGEECGVIFNGRVAVRIKRKIYSMIVRPVLFCDLETAALTKRQEAEHEVVELKILEEHQRNSRD